MFIIINEQNKILASAAAPVGESWFGYPWTETDSVVVRATDGQLYFKDSLPDGVQELIIEEV